MGGSLVAVQGVGVGLERAWGASSRDNPREGWVGARGLNSEAGHQQRESIGKSRADRSERTLDGGLPSPLGVLDKGRIASIANRLLSCLPRLAHRLRSSLLQLMAFLTSAAHRLQAASKLPGLPAQSSCAGTGPAARPRPRKRHIRTNTGAEPRLVSSLLPGPDASGPPKSAPPCQVVSVAPMPPAKSAEMPPDDRERIGAALRGRDWAQMLGLRRRPGAICAETGWKLVAADWYVARADTTTDELPDQQANEARIGLTVCRWLSAQLRSVRVVAKAWRASLDMFFSPLARIVGRPWRW